MFLCPFESFGSPHGFRRGKHCSFGGLNAFEIAFLGYSFYFNTDNEHKYGPSEKNAFNYARAGCGVVEEANATANI